eukprot:2735559-Amphidinium_carterae.1
MRDGGRCLLDELQSGNVLWLHAPILQRDHEEDLVEAVLLQGFRDGFRSLLALQPGVSMKTCGGTSSRSNLYVRPSP